MAALRSRCEHYNFPCGFSYLSIFMAALWNMAGHYILPAALRKAQRAGI